MRSYLPILRIPQCDASTLLKFLLPLLQRLLPSFFPVRLILCCCDSKSTPPGH